MKKTLLISTIIFTLFPLLAYATSGACSDHGGANCAIGPINNQTVCNDGFLSSVAYGDMEECIGYGASCVSYVSGAQYVIDKKNFQTQLNTEQTQIDQLTLSLSSLDDQEAQDILNEQQSAVGRMSEAGLQGQISIIEASYVKKKLAVSEQIDTATAQYNALVQQDNSLCQTYSYDERNAICTQNLGSNYKLSGTSCVAQPVPYTAPASLPAPAPVSQPKPDQDVAPVVQPANSPPVVPKVQTQVPVPVKNVSEKLLSATSMASTTTQPTTTLSQAVAPAQEPLTFWERIVSPLRDLWKLIFP